MDESNKLELKDMGIKGLYKMGDFGFNGKDVADLYYEPHKANEVWKIISIGVDRMLEQCK